MSLQAATKGCWTCKDRKIACDKRIPICVKCKKSGRQCLGYGTRLSWPRYNDQKRAIVSHLARSPMRTSRTPPGAAHYLNVFCKDLEISYDLKRAGTLSTIAREMNLDPEQLTQESFISNAPRLLYSPAWMPMTLTEKQLHLISYFDQGPTICLWPIQNARIRDLTLRMAFEDSSHSSYAIIFSIFALSSLTLSDAAQASEYKRKAFNAVRASAFQASDTKSVLQRIIAANFIACYETYAHPNVSIDWATAICYAKTAAIKIYAADETYIGDLALILDWVYYYDIVSRFAVRHFNRRCQGMLECARKQHLMHVEMNSPEKTYVVQTLGCSIEVLNTLASIIDVVLEAESGGNLDHEVLDRLERRLQYAKQDIKFEEFDNLVSTPTATQVSLIAELHRLAGMIYLHRATRQSLSTNPKLERLVNDAFGVMENLETCDRTLILFVVGCEARRDDQRAIVLKLISNTRARFRMNVARLSMVLERFWAQDDLDIDQSIGYASKVTTVLSSSNWLPALS